MHTNNEHEPVSDFNFEIDMGDYIKFVLKASTHTKMSILSKCILLLSAVLMVSTESLLRISLIYIFIFYACGNQLEKSENENPIYFGSL